MFQFFFPLKLIPNCLSTTGDTRIHKVYKNYFISLNKKTIINKLDLHFVHSTTIDALMNYSFTIQL